MRLKEINGREKNYEIYDFPDSLYQDHWEHAEAYGVVSDTGEMMACIEVCPEEWSNRLMVTLSQRRPKKNIILPNADRWKH